MTRGTAVSTEIRTVYENSIWGFYNLDRIITQSHGPSMQCLAGPGIVSCSPVSPTSRPVPLAWQDGRVAGSPLSLFCSFSLLPSLPECFEMGIFKVTRQFWGQTLLIQGGYCGRQCTFLGRTEPRSLEHTHLQPHLRGFQENGICSTQPAAAGAWRRVQRLCNSYGITLSFVEFSGDGFKLTESLQEHDVYDVLLHCLLQT